MSHSHPPTTPRGAQRGPVPLESVALLAAFVLTILDATATHTWIASGVADEVNPLLRHLMAELGAGTALALRVAVGGALLVLLRSLTDHSRHARTGLLGTVAVLGSLGVWHLQGVLLLTAT